MYGEGDSGGFTGFFKRHSGVFLRWLVRSKNAVSVSWILDMEKMLSNMTSIFSNNWGMQVATDNNVIDIIPCMV